jgi:diacylglycerol kinase (ATP)
MENQWFIIANPASGNGAVRKNLNEIERVFREKKIPFTLRVSTYPREVTTIVQKAIHTEGYRKIIGVGGDGTMNEIVNGIFQQKTVPTTDIIFTMLPIGTGNDWATTHQIPRKIEDFIPFLLSKGLLAERGVTKLQDVGVVHYTDAQGSIKTHYFANAGGLAYDSLVVRSVEAQKRYLFGKKIAYFLHILKCLWAYKPEKVQVEFDGQTVTDFFYTINLGINKTSGGGMQLTPQAVNDDGLMALTLIRNMPKWKVVYYTSKLRDGSIGSIKNYVSLHQVKNIKIKSLENPVFIETDGELLGQTPVEISILEKKLCVLVKLKN